MPKVTTFVELAKAGAYMAGDRRVHRTERSKWRHTFRGLVADALAALHADDPAPAQRAVGKMVDLAATCAVMTTSTPTTRWRPRSSSFPTLSPCCGSRSFVTTVLAAFASRVPERLIRWEAGYGWTRRGYGQVAEQETALAVPLARLLATPDMWRTFAESYLEALDAAGRADPKRPRTVYGSFDETRNRRRERTDDLAAWHEMLLERFAGMPEEDLLDRLVASPALAGPGRTFLRAKIAACRGDVTQAAALVTESLKELPGHTSTRTSL